LHDLAWSVLPSLAGRPVTVAPSATAWLRTTETAIAARESRETSRRVVVAAGPGLPGAQSEAKSVAAVYGVTPLLGENATVEAVLSSLPTADIVHLAAHGRLALGNPLFSDLLMADGRVMVYDIAALPSMPRTVVLAACYGGRSVVHVGDALLGLSAELLTHGCVQLIAPVVPVPDAGTEPVMWALHERLAAGAAPASALAQVQQEMGREYPAAWCFVCLGSGVVPVFG
jgi:CHAT domain-containing protein